MISIENENNIKGSVKNEATLKGTISQSTLYIGGGDADLSNYYTKDQVYNKQEIDDKLDNIDIPEIDLSGKADKADTLKGYGIENAYTKDEVDGKLSSVYKFCGSVDNYQKLQTEKSKLHIGDTYNILKGDKYPSNIWIDVDWTYEIEKQENKYYLKFFENNKDITNEIPKATIAIMLEKGEKTLHTLTEKGWEVNSKPIEEDIITRYTVDIDNDDNAVIKDGDNLSWTGWTWDILGGIIDLSDYYTKDEVNNEIKEVNNNINETNNDIDNINNDINEIKFDLSTKESWYYKFNNLTDNDEIFEEFYPSVSAVVKYVKEKINEVVNTFRGNVESVSQLPVYEINENIGDAYNVFSYDSSPEVLEQSREVSWSGDVTQIDNSYYLTVKDETGNDITQNLPTGLTLNTISSGENFSLDSKTANGWEIPTTIEQTVEFVEYTAPDLVQSPIEGDYAVWNGYYWSTLMDTLYSNYFTKEQTEALVSGELDKLPIEDGENDFSAVQKTDLIDWEINSFNSFQDIEEIKNIKGIKFDDTKENILIGAYGKNSVSLGGKSQAVGSRSLAEGSKNISIGDNSHTEGELNIVLGGDSHGEGIGNLVEAHNAHGEGNGNKIGVGGNNAHAEGAQNEVDADSAHVEGRENEAHGAASHVGGVGSKTTSEAGTAFAHGQGVIANRGTQIVLGSYNKEDNSKVFILGNGTNDSNRKNIFTIDDNGNAVFEGNIVAAGANIVKDFQLAEFYTKNEVDGKISSVYKYCGSVDNLDELLKVSTKSIGDTYNVVNGGGVSTLIYPDWEYSITEVDGKCYLKISENGKDITNTFYKGFTMLPYFIEGFSNLTEYGWQVEGNPFEYFPDAAEQLCYQLWVECKSGDNVAWTGLVWDVLSGIVDLNNYYTKAQIDTKVNNINDSLNDTNTKLDGINISGKQDKSNMINGSIYIGMSPDMWEGSYPSTPTMMRYVQQYTEEKTKDFCTKTEVDNMIGDISTVLDVIIEKQSQY